MTYPWEYSREVTEYFYRKIIGPVSKGTCVSENLNDSERLYYRKGDIIRFDFHLRPPGGRNWSDWFALPKDQKRFWIKRPNIPVYASKQLALVIGRYKKTKYKYAIFRDYGVVVMILSGRDKGRIKRYWSTRPFRIVNRFNEPLKFKYLKNLIPQNIQQLHNQDDSNESRNLFVSKYYEYFYEG